MFGVSFEDIITNFAVAYSYTAPKIVSVTAEMLVETGRTRSREITELRWK